MRASAWGLCLGEETAKGKISWRTARELHEAFDGVLGRNGAEEWYRSTVVEPSPGLISLRARLAAETGYPVENIVGLTEPDVELVLAKYKG
ncbi:hypothetical protein IAR50_007611 [Cryptococcus sp. DSM 104548]